jgi:hypothetical protein
MNRVLQWDGIVVQKYKGEPGQKTDPEDIKAVREFVEKRREASTPFDIVTGGRTPSKNPESVLPHVKSLADAGATWWLEEMWSLGEKDFLRRIEQGPPAY